MRKFLQLLTLLYFSYSFAQTTFEKGYYIDNSGKRKECYIKNLDWRYNPTSFEFKDGVSDENPKTASIKDVSEFGMDNISKYKRYTVNIDYSFTDASKLKKQKAPEFKKETLFLKTLNEGDANLYVYKNGPFVKYFYETKTVPVEQLVYIRYLTDKGEATENNQFRQQLFNNVRNEKISEENIKRLKYNESELTTHFEKFNASGVAKSEKYERKSTVKPFSLGVTAGVSSATVKFENYKAAETSKTIFKVGLEAEYILPFNNNAWAIFISPNYSKFESSKDFLLYEGPFVNSPPSNNKVDITYSNIEIPVGIRYYIPLNKSSRLFLDVAYVVNTKLGDPKIMFNNLDWTTYDISGSNNVTLGLGYCYKKFNISLKYNTERELFKDYVFLSSRYNSAGLVVGYRFL